MSVRQRISHELHARRGVVATVSDLSPSLRRVTVALAEGEPAVPWVPLAVGDHVKLALPHPGTGELNLPRRGSKDQAGPQPRPTLRDYTVRAVPDPRHVVIDLVVHGSGPGSDWAASAVPGTAVGVLGPRGSVLMPGDRPRYLCLVDGSALPVAARLLEEVPADAVVDVAVQAAAGAVPVLPRRAHRLVTVVPGNDGSGLAAHLRTQNPAPGDLVWAAGEATSMLAVRRAAKAIGVSGEDLEVHGYWKRGVAGRDHHAPLEE